MNLYHEHSRALQDRFDTRRLADRLAERCLRAAFTRRGPRVHREPQMFFLATADAAGQPDCSYKGGRRASCASLAAELAFPSYDGNGMFRSLGNVLRQPGVGLLFLDFEQPRRLRVNGRRRSCRRPAAGEFDGRAARGARAAPSRSSPTARATSTACSWSRPRPTRRGRGTSRPSRAGSSTSRTSCPRTRRVDRRRADTSSLIYSGLE